MHGISSSHNETGEAKRRVAEIQAMSVNPATTRIIVVDPDELSREKLSSWLKEQDYNVLTTEPGSNLSELTYNNSSSSHSQLIIIDIDAYINDTSSLEKLVEKFSSIPIILISSSDTSNDLITSLFNLGAVDFIVKPIQAPEMLLRRVDKCLQGELEKVKEKLYQEMLQSEQQRGEELRRQVEEKTEELAQIKEKIEQQIETPMESATRTLEKLMKGDMGPDESKQAIFSTLKTLGSANIYSPDFSRTQDGSIDEATRQWLQTEYTHSDGLRPIITERRSSLASSTSQDMDSSELMSPRIEHHHIDPESINTFSFDVKKYSLQELINVGVFFFQDLDLIDIFDIPIDRLEYFIKALLTHYKANPYHNFHHAMDVTQFVYSCLKLPYLCTFFTDLDRLGLILAAISHDVGHPGNNNVFQINAQTDLAIKYNDNSVLENYHAATAFRLLRKPKYNFLENLGKDEFMEMRRVSISAILSTDMASHYEILSKFQARLKSGELDPESKDDRQQLSKIILKCADVSNVTRPFPVAKSWAISLKEEFCAQGDLEKEMNLPLSPFMDRETFNLEQMQCNFIDYIALPLFKVFIDAVSDASTLMDEIAANRTKWEQNRCLNKDTSNNDIDGEDNLEGAHHKGVISGMLVLMVLPSQQLEEYKNAFYEKGCIVHKAISMEEAEECLKSVNYDATLFAPSNFPELPKMLHRICGDKEVDSGTLIAVGTADHSPHETNLSVDAHTRPEAIFKAVETNFGHVNGNFSPSSPKEDFESLKNDANSTIAELNNCLTKKDMQEMIKYAAVLAQTASSLKDSQLYRATLHLEDVSGKGSSVAIIPALRTVELKYHLLCSAVEAHS